MLARCLPGRSFPARFITGCLSLLCLVSAAGAIEFQGSWQQGGLLLGVAPPGTQILFEGEPVALADDGRFVIGLGRDAPQSVSLVLREGDREEVHQYSVSPRQYDTQRVEGVPQHTVTPPESVLERIREEAALVHKARANTGARLEFEKGFARPLEGPITGVYGSQRFYNGVPRNPHYGLDIAAPTGALVSAPAPGTVRLVHNDMYFSGGTLIIDHGFGVSSTFIHLSEILVHEGDRVEVGDPIARVGATGRATGPHLDWRMNWNEVRIDPALVLEYFPLLSAAEQP